MNLTNKQKEELWGDGGPYSEARMIIENRILDDSITRICIAVEANINPTSYKIIKDNLEDFADDSIIKDLIDSAFYQSKEEGYLLTAFSIKFFARDKNNDIIKEAEKKLEETNQAIIEMHKYVIEKIEKPAFTIKLK